MTDDAPKLQFPVQGGRQFQTARREMLDAFDHARTKAAGRKVGTLHGTAAEGGFREWLLTFLPKRFGVTPGYVISQGLGGDVKLTHFDVILYDVLNSPVLWVEDHPDTSVPGRSMAIPAEHVLGVLEVKATLTPASMKQAVEHLGDLRPLMAGADDASERYKLFLPDRFFCGVVFFELRKQYEYRQSTITNALPGIDLRGFVGGLVLRGEGHAVPETGRIKIARSPTPVESTIGRSKHSLLKGVAVSGMTRVTDGLHLGTILSWSETYFSQFAFDLIAMMQGTYEPGRLSSFHGLGYSEPNS